MSPISEFHKIHPEAKRHQLGEHLVWIWFTTTPAVKFTFVLEEVAGPYLVILKVKSGFDESIARDILDMFAGSNCDFSCDKISVIDGFRTNNRNFDQIAFLPPPVAQCFRYESPQLNSATAWLVPAYCGEFGEGQSESDFSVALHRGSQISPAAWDRIPTPQIFAWLIDPWPGGMLRKSERATALAADNLPTIFSALPNGIRIRLAGLLGSTLECCRNKGNLRFSGSIPNAKPIAPVDVALMDGAEFTVDFLTSKKQNDYNG